MNFMEFWLKYKWRILSVLFAIVLAAFLFTIGFWKTLLLFVLVGIAFFIGSLLDEGGRARVSEFFRSIFKSNK
jgi:uncharacterized membrane protein